MQCDICKRYYSEVIILRKEKFNGKTNELFKEETKRVCWGCARYIVRENIYSFGDFWDFILTEKVVC